MKEMKKYIFPIAYHIVSATLLAWMAQTDKPKDGLASIGFFFALLPGVIIELNFKNGLWQRK